MSTNCYTTHGLNGSCPERTSTINVTQVMYTSLGGHVEDVFIVDRGSVGDPITGGNAVTLSEVPVTGAPLSVYFGGLRMVINRDYTVNAQVVTFINATFNENNTIVADYWTASA